MENSERILQDVEEARLMVVSWKRDRYEQQVARAAVTIKRMRYSRMWRKLLYGIQKLGVKSERHITYRNAITRTIKDIWKLQTP